MFIETHDHSKNSFSTDGSKHFPNLGVFEFQLNIEFPRN